ncbi:hypothetical protein EON81_17270 [bacterium]|nr:MAG: hypothetical protein EON81_17270 [bacterium]
MIIRQRWLLPALLGISASSPAQNRDADVNVVNAAMLSFFTWSAWNDSWRHGERIVLSGEWNYTSRADFGDMVSQANRDLSALDQGIYNRLKKVRGGGTDRKPRELFSLQLDPRVLVGAKTYTAKGRLDMGWSPGEVQVKGKDGKEKIVRTMGSLSPPSYSADGRYAALRMTNVPWSIHSCDLAFFLQKQGQKWIVVLVSPTYYP